MKEGYHTARKDATGQKKEKGSYCEEAVRVFPYLVSGERMFQEQENIFCVGFATC